MSVFTDQQAEHLAVFANTDHFGGTQPFHYRGSDDPIEVPGVFDADHSKAKNSDESSRDECDAKIHCVPEATLAAMQTAVADFSKDGWFVIFGERYSIAGITDRDGISGTLLLLATNNKTLRRAYPLDRGREVNTR